MKRVQPGTLGPNKDDFTAAISSSARAKPHKTIAATARASVVSHVLPVASFQHSKQAVSEKLAFSGMAHIPNSLDRPMSFAQRRHQKMMKEQQDLDAETDALDGSYGLTPTSLPKTKLLNLGRLLGDRRRLGEKCCARRGCTCHAPDPYTMSPDDSDDMIAIKEKIDDAGSEIQSRSAWLSPSSSTSSWRSSWKSTTGGRSNFGWTKLHHKVTGSHVPMPPNSPPENSPRRRRLAEQAVQGFLSKNGKETESADQTATNDAEPSLGEAKALEDESPRGSFFKKRASMRGSLASTASQDDNPLLSMARAGLAKMNAVTDLPQPSEHEANELGIAQMRNIAHKRITRMQDKLKEKREESLLQRRYENLPHEEKEFLEKVFIRFDADCSGTLDWDEVTACLRELGLAGTNTLEKREVLKVCRDALKTAQVQQSEVMALRQMSAQARLRQHRQGRFVRLDERRKVKLARKGMTSVNVTKAFIPKRVTDEDKRKAKVLEETKTARTLNKFDLFSSLIDKVGSNDSSLPGKATLPPTRSTSSEHGSGSQGEEETSSRSSSKQPSSVHDDDESESDGARSGSEEHNADVEDVIDFSTDTVSFDFFSFAVLVVPRVRQRLRELQSSKVLRYFCHFDRDGSGALSVPKCEEIARCLGLDPRLMSQALEANKTKKSGTLDFAAFEKSVMTCRELAERGMRSRENAILDETGIPYELFDDFRTTIIQIYESFKAGSYYDEHDGERRITATSAFSSLRQLGFMPRSHWEREHVQNLLAKANRQDQEFEDSDTESVSGLHIADHPELNFEEYLTYLQQVRSFFKSGQVVELRRLFDRFDKDRSNTLSVAEVSVLLEELDILPRSRREQEELGQLIQSVDRDGNGVLDFMEFQELMPRIEEKFASLRYESELEYALARGFDEVQLSEFRWMFDIIDADGSGTLDSKEVRKGLNAMKKPVSSDLFEETWKKLDADGSGSLDFFEFIDLMKMLRDGTGMFSENTAKVPSQISLLDDRVLRVILGHLNYSSSYLRCLERSDLVDLACTCFGIAADENLSKRLRVHSLTELIEYAKAQGDKNVEHHMPGGAR